jgi:CheY-like chemotaxis protein
MLPRLVVLEASLPKMFGFQVCELMKRNEQLRAIPVVLVGAIHHRDRYRRQAAETYGADEYLERPNLPEGLLGILRRHGIAARQPRWLPIAGRGAARPGRQRGEAERSARPPVDRQQAPARPRRIGYARAEPDPESTISRAPSDSRGSSSECALQPERFEAAIRSMTSSARCPPRWKRDAPIGERIWSASVNARTSWAWSSSASPACEE